MKLRSFVNLYFLVAWYFFLKWTHATCMSHDNFNSITEILFTFPRVLKNVARNAWALVITILTSLRPHLRLGLQSRRDCNDHLRTQKEHQNATINNAWLILVCFSCRYFSLLKDKANSHQINRIYLFYLNDGHHIEIDSHLDIIIRYLQYAHTCMSENIKLRLCTHR